MGVCQNGIIFVADGTMESVVKTLLRDRYRSLGLRAPPSVSVYTHPRRDPGMFSNVDLIRQLVVKYSKETCILVLIDEEWSGSPGSSRIDERIRSDLNRIGLPKNEVIVTKPTFDAWAWTNSPCFLKELQWESGSYQELLEFLEEQGYPVDKSKCPKPADPKAALEWMLQRIGRPRAREFYIAIAQCAGLRNCCIPSFNKFKNIIATWYG